MSPGADPGPSNRLTGPGRPSLFPAGARKGRPRGGSVPHPPTDLLECYCGGPWPGGGVGLCCGGAGGVVSDGAGVTGVGAGAGAACGGVGLTGGVTGAGVSGRTGVGAMAA